MRTVRVARVLAVVGSRSEALSLAPVVRALRADPRFEVELGLASRPRERAGEVLGLHGLRADFDLLAEPGDGRTRAFVVRARTALGRAIRERRPDWVALQGASVAASAASRAAAAEGIDVAHLGAGLAQCGAGLPWRELERARRLSLRARLHLAPSEEARQALLAAGVEDASVRVVGCPEVEGLLAVHERVGARPLKDFAADLGPLLTSLLEGWTGRLVLVTARRRDALDEMIAALRQAAARHVDWLFALPVHPSPRVQTRVHQGLRGVANVVRCEPLGLEAFTWLMARSDALLTDSILLQGLGAALGRPVLVARAGVERIDLARDGLVRPVGGRALGILAGLERVLLDHALYAALSAVPRVGVTHPTRRIVAALDQAGHARAWGREVSA